MRGRAEGYAPLVASALIIATVCAGWLLMPKLMLAISDGGPLLGVFVAILFILSFFGVLWLRARYQRQRDRI